ncbi:MAG TPA: hypothetical protein VMG14_06335 [Thermoplasmata archaeon]|nr:hypothetical protein [Thermoplasmata archaeon]
MARARAAAPESALARLVLDRLLPLRRGRSLAVVTWDHALPWARAIALGAFRRGLVPTVVVHDEGTFFAALAEVGPGPLRADRRELLPPADGVVRLEGPAEFPRLLGLPRGWIEPLVRPLGPRRARTGPASRTVRLRIADATPAAADRYGVDLERWRSELLRASLVDPRHLTAAGRALGPRGGRPHRIRIRHANGTDLSLALAREPPILETGVPPAGGWAEVPSGRWRARVEPGSADGWFETNRASYDRYAEYPVALLGRLEFGDGRLRDFEGDRAAQAFHAFARSGKGRVRIRSVLVGLNPEADRAPETADLAAGTVTLEVGDPAPRPRDRLPRFALLASLAGAEVELDGRPWILGGALPVARPRRPTPVGARRTPRPSTGRARGAAGRSARR